MKQLFFNAKGERVSDITMTDEPSEYVIQRFENERISIVLCREIMVSLAPGQPISTMKSFTVEVWNIISTDFEGRPIKPKSVKDTDATTSFRELDAALGHYRQLILQNSDSHLDGKGELIEVGNKFTPPSKDIPLIAEESPASDIFGSW